MSDEKKVVLDTEGVVVPEVLKRKVLVVDSLAASTTGLVEAVRQAAKDGKEMVVVDSISDMKPGDALAFKPRPEVDEPIPEKRRKPLWDRAKSDNRMATAFIAAAAGMLGPGWGDADAVMPGRHYIKTIPKPVKCGLPECKMKTTHNGGYCCPEHCREHRRRQKESRKA